LGQKLLEQFLILTSVGYRGIFWIKMEGSALLAGLMIRLQVFFETLCFEEFLKQMPTQQQYYETLIDWSVVGIFK